MDIESETDRRLLCEKILYNIDIAKGKQAVFSQTATGAIAAPAVPDKLPISSASGVNPAA